MNAKFKKESFNVNGYVEVEMSDGRVFVSQFPSVMWEWLKGKQWASVSVTDTDFGQSYGWDRI